MFCKKCGKRISDDVLICENCGTEVSSAETENKTVAETGVTDAGIEASDVENSGQSQGNTVSDNNEKPVKKEQSSLNEKKQEQQTASDKKPVPKNDKKVRSEITTKKKKIRKRTIIIGAVALLLCVALIVLTFPYIKNAFAKLFLSSEDYFAYIVKNNSEETAKSLANTFDSLKRASLEGSSANGHIDVELEKPFHDILADVTSDIEIGGDIGSTLGGFMDIDLSVGGMTSWVDEVSADYELKSDGENSQIVLDVDINDTEFGKAEAVNAKKDNTTYIGIPGYNKMYFSTKGTENTTDKSAEDMIASLPEKELTEILIWKYIGCAAENVGEVRETGKTVDAGKFSKNITALSTEIDKKEMDKITELFIDELEKDKDLKEAVKKAAKDSGKSEDEIIKSIEKTVREINSFYSENLKSGLELSIYVDAKGTIIGYELQGNKFEFSNCTITKWFEIGNDISAKIGAISFELTGSGELKDNKVELDYTLDVAGFHMADISIYDLDYKKMKDGLYDAKANIEFTDNVSKIGNMLFGAEKKDSVPKKLINVIPELKLDMTLSQKNADEMSLAMTVNRRGETVISVDINNKNGKKKDVTIPESHIDIKTDEFLKTWLKDLDDEKFFNFLENAGAPNVSLLRIGYKGFKKIYTSDNALVQFGLDLIM